MSFLKMGNQDSIDKKSVVKLINRYAESYKIKEAENSFLASQSQDLRSNLTIKAEIINTLISQLSLDEKMSQVYELMNTEIVSLRHQVEELTLNLEEAKNKVSLNLILDALFRENCFR